MLISRIPGVYKFAVPAMLTLFPGIAFSAATVTVCYPRDQMLSYIERDYQGSQAAHGIIRPFSIMEVWVSERNGDWLIVTTDLDGNSCIVAYGEDFSADIGTSTEQS